MTTTLPTVAILAGGLARRLRPISETIPKSLVEVAGEPFIAHQLRLLKRQGFDRVVLCIGYLGEQIEAFVGNGHAYGLDVAYSREEEDCLLGTGGALRNALPLCGECLSILYGDSYLIAPLVPPLERFLQSGLRGMMTVFRNDGRWDASNVVFRDGHILEYSKSARHSGMQHIDYGFCALRREALERYEPGSVFDLADVFRDLLASDELLGVEVFERFYEMGSPAGLAEIAQYLARGQSR